MKQRVLNLYAVSASFFGAATVCAQGSAAQGMWSHVGGLTSRNAVTHAIVPDIGQARWTRSFDEGGLAIVWRWQSTPIVAEEFVFALGTVRPAGADVLKCFAIKRSDGGIAWSRVLPNGGASLGSQSSPALSAARGELFIATGSFLTAVRASDGAELWQTTLMRAVVNASPVVTDDLATVVGTGIGGSTRLVAQNRVFITDYDFDASGSPGSVYCLNVDPFDATANPYQQGEIVWTFALGGTSGNSVAYVRRREGGAGLVYVASAGEPEVTGGSVIALDARATTMPMMVWNVSNTIEQGYFGGVSVALGASGRLEVFASSYSFYDLANTLRLDARSGAMLGEVSSNRSSTTPMVLPVGLCVAGASGAASRVVLSAGYDGFGSVASLVGMAMGENGSAAQWDSWTSAGRRMGGWNHQPVVSIAGGRSIALVGTIATGSNTQAAQRLMAVDISRVPADPLFIVQQANGSTGGVGGGSVAMAGLNAYSIGATGLAAFGPAWTGADVRADGRIGIDDLYAWEAGAGVRDVDGDGDVDAQDRATMVAWLRWQERSTGHLMGARGLGEVVP